jgi:hypothetical protein
MKKDLPPGHIRAARIVAIAADVIQIGMLPFFPVSLSPVGNVLDVLVALFMIFRLGWHPAFLPTLIAEMLPFVDVFPSWTLAVFFATRGGPRADRAGDERRVDGDESGA